MTSRLRTPKVSVCVITYNQERYIGECLQSIVDQVTDFEFEIIVGDDASTDGTRSVVMDFATRYSNIIRPIYHEENIGGGARNFRMVHLAARGEYVSHIDGDDYMLPGKLQAQANVLDLKPEVAYCAHAVKVIDSNIFIGAGEGLPVYGTVYDILSRGAYFVHSSIMYRRDRGSVDGFPENCIDYYMHLERACAGLVFLDKSILGCYRSHPSSISRQATSRINSEKYYEEAFDRALSLDLEVSKVERARLDRRMRFAIAQYLSGDLEGYRERIRITSRYWQYASLKHKLLHFSRALPGVVSTYFLLKGNR